MRRAGHRSSGAAGREGEGKRSGGHQVEEGGQLSEDPTGAKGIDGALGQWRTMEVLSVGQ